MNNNFKLKFLAASLIAASSTSISVPVFAQSLALEEIFVTARRKDESIQDVPIMVNGVTGEELAQLNIRKFEDLEATVAGLTLQEDSIAPNASLRGVRFDTFTGGTPTVEFYLNDIPGSPQTIMQAMFDVARVEVLRGPQGTLRGRASPSGSITVTTAQAETDVFAGFVDTTLTEKGDKNIQAAVNIPLIEDVLGMRLSGFWEENGNNEVDNIAIGGNSEYDGDGYRLSLNYTPTDSLSIRLMHQHIEPERSINAAVESANIADPSQPASPVLIRAKDRKAVTRVTEVSQQEFEVTSLNLSWDMNEAHQLNYSGGYIDEKFTRNQPTDVTDAGNNFPLPGLTGALQPLDSRNDGYSHEIRIQSTEDILGGFEYVAGAFYQHTSPGTDITNQSGVVVTADIPMVGTIPVAAFLTDTPIYTGGASTEKSVFINLTYFLSEDTELSGGLRKIEFETERELLVSGNVLDDSSDEWDTTIYAATIKHNFSPDVMAYVSYGTSWRRGISAVGDFSLLKSDLQDEFTNLDPEESESLEIGAKTTWMDQRLRLNVAAYIQDFEDYPYRAGGSGIYYAEYGFGGFGPGGIILDPKVGQHNFVAAVPVEVYGLEADVNFVATENLMLGAVMSYSKGEIDNGKVPCNDYLPNDGVPDSSGNAPSFADIIAAAGSDNLTACNLTLRANFAPLFTGTFHAEYSFNVGELDSYVRGQLTYYGNSKNDPTNPYDDVDAYNIFNLYLGVRDPEGRWEAMLYAKNLADTEEVLSRNASPGSLGYTLVDAGTGAPYGSDSVTSTYREVTLTDPREIGVNFRYNF